MTVDVTVILSFAHLSLQNILERELIALNNTSASLVNINATLNDTRNVLIAGTSIFEVMVFLLTSCNAQLCLENILR